MRLQILEGIIDPEQRKPLEDTNWRELSKAQTHKFRFEFPVFLASQSTNFIIPELVDPLIEVSGRLYAKLSGLTSGQADITLTINGTSRLFSYTADQNIVIDFIKFDSILQFDGFTPVSTADSSGNVQIAVSSPVSVELTGFKYEFFGVGDEV